MELKKEIANNGDTLCIDLEIDNSKNKIIVIFKTSKYSDNNKWGEKQVLTDVDVSRCQITDIYRNADPTGSKLSNFLINNKSDVDYLINCVTKISDKTDKIYIGLPTNILDDTRVVKNSFRPLIVDINSQDASRCFQDFDLFKSKAVNVAYDALILGKNPTSKNDFISFYEVGYLHNQICSPSSTEEQESEK